MKNILQSPLVQVALFAVLLFLLPFLLTNDYYVSILILCGINAIIVVGLNLLMGYAGQISLGHAAFYGIGAYTTAIATVHYGVPMEASLPLAVLVAVVVALAIGIPSLKLSGHYLAMATLGFGIIVYIFFNETIELTGGPSGFVGIERLGFFGIWIDEDIHYYYVVCAMLCLVTLISLNLIKSRMGRALRAIHTSEKAAMVSGIDIARYKLFVFVLSAAFAAVAGYLYAHYLTFVAPSSFTFLFSVALVTMVVLGGMANMWGGIVGAAFITTLPELLRVFENIEVLIFGAILVVCMMYLPDGLVGGGIKLVRTIKARRSSES